MIGLNIFEEQDKVEHTRTTDTIPAQPPMPSPTEHGTSGTPDKPADAAADATTTPPDYNTREATKQ